MRVHVVQRQQQLRCVEFGVILRQLVLLRNQVEKFSSWTEFQHEIELFLSLKSAHQPQNKRVFNLVSIALS
jgi:hypothetical protein